MHKISALTFIFIFQLFYAATCSEFGFWKRQDTNSSAPSNSSDPTSLAGIIDALNENGIPSTCDTTCIPAYNVSLTCQEPACECNDEYEKSLFDCYLCAGDALHASFDTVQEKIDNLNEQCFNAGFNLTKLTFPGENSTRVVAPPTSSVSFTLSLPTSAGPTPNQGVNAPTQVTQGTQGTATPQAPGASQNASSPNPTPVPESSQTPSSDGIKVIPVVELAFSIGLMLMGSLLISF